MKTDVITISSSGENMEAALQQAEKTAAYKGLSKKNAIHLRLLTEEMMGMMRSIAGKVEGKYWIEDEDGTYQLHLKVHAIMNDEKREKLISASTSGKNEATKGIMGKIRAFFEPADENPLFLTATMSDGPEGLTDMSWSMYAYREQLERYVAEQQDGAAEAWDELEKSVVSHVADDVKVSIRGRDVEMIIYKKMA